MPVVDYEKHHTRQRHQVGQSLGPECLLCCSRLSLTAMHLSDGNSIPTHHVDTHSNNSDTRSVSSPRPGCISHSITKSSTARTTQICVERLPNGVGRKACPSVTSCVSCGQIRRSNLDSTAVYILPFPVCPFPSFAKNRTLPPRPYVHTCVPQKTACRRMPAPSTPAGLSNGERLRPHLASFLPSCASRKGT